MHPFVPWALLLSRGSSTERCDEPAWCARAEELLICCGIRSLRPCCGKAHRSRTSHPFCATAPLRLLRSTRRWTSRHCGRSRNPGRRYKHANSSRRILSGHTSGSRFRVEVSRSSAEKLCRVLGSERAALRLLRYRHRVGGIGRVGFATRSATREHHPIGSLSPRRGPTPRGAASNFRCREVVTHNPLHSDRRTDPTTRPISFAAGGWNAPSSDLQHAVLPVGLHGTASFGRVPAALLLHHSRWSGDPKYQIPEWPSPAPARDSTGRARTV